MSGTMPNAEGPNGQTSFFSEITEKKTRYVEINIGQTNKPKKEPTIVSAMELIKTG